MDPNPYSTTNSSPIQGKCKISYKQIATTVGVCVLVCDYALIASVYLSSQMAEHSYALKYWFKSLVRFPLMATVSFATLLIPSLVLSWLIVRWTFGTHATSTKHIASFSIASLCSYLLLVFVVQVGILRSTSMSLGYVLMILVFFALGMIVSVIMSRRRPGCR